MNGSARVAIGFVCLCARVLITCPAAHAEETPCPQIENHPRGAVLREQYLQSRVSVTVGALPTDLSQRIPSTVDTRTWKHWSAYTRGRPLSEEAFFALCGHPDEAKRARDHYSAADRRIGVGKVLTLSGTAVWLVGLLLTIGADNKAGVPIIVVGAGTTGIGWATSHSGYSRRYQSWASFQQASAVADEYNEKLCDSLSTPLEDRVPR